MDTPQTAIVQLGHALRHQGYQFTTVTPETHRRVLARPPRHNPDLRDIFGWNRPFQPVDLPGHMLALMEAGQLVEGTPSGALRSSIRFSTLGSLLLAHSAYPTTTANAVFFGPDTYRFARAISDMKEREAFSPKSVVDIGTGSGAGGLYCGAMFESVQTILLSDINTAALSFAAINAAINGMKGSETRHSDILAEVPERVDFIIANPPYLVDKTARAYRHGGGFWGCELSLKMMSEALDHLTADGRFLLYTGTPIVGGKDMFLEAALPLLQDRTKSFHYEEIDPDVFAEELEHAPYDQADRIASVCLSVHASNLHR